MSAQEGLESFRVWVRPRMKRHLEEEILPFWLQPAVLGNPVGLFPTWINQVGVPDWSRTNYVRMHGRQTYGYLAAYKILGKPELLRYGLAGLCRLETYEHPGGGYYSTVDARGVPKRSPISIQDQYYSVLPYVMAYRVTKRHEYLEKVWRFVDFIDKGPYLQRDGTYVDSLLPDYRTIAPFETQTLNIVTLIDFLNAVLIPALYAAPAEDVTDERKQVLVRWVDHLVREFYGKGLFWNDQNNRTDYQAKHVDLGHTSKSFGVLMKANLLFTSWGLPSRYAEVMEEFPQMLQAASHPVVGWWTVFDVSNTTFRQGAPEWWRHILVNQTAYLYAQTHRELIPLLENGVRTWFTCDYVDRVRTCRGIRSNLSADGRIMANEDELTNKENLWKSCYHEIEHVLTFLEGE